MRYKSLGSDFDRLFRNDLNDNLQDISDDMDNLQSQVNKLVGQTAELVDKAGAIIVDYDTPSSVIFNSDSSGQAIFAMAGGNARLINIPDPTKPYVVTPASSIETYIVYYLVVDSGGNLSFKRYNLVDDSDFIVGILYNNKITLFYAQNNGKYETGEVIASINIKYHKQAKIVYIPKGTQVTQDQYGWYSTNHAFFKISTTEVARYFAINRMTSEAVSLLWKDVDLLSREYIVFGYSFRGQVYIYGKGFLSEQYTYIKGWTKDPFKMIIESVKNPFVRTNVKLIGDSITSGAGGTGYSQTGELMFTDKDGVVHNSNLATATCWANMMRNLLASYAGDTYIEPLHKGFYWSTTPDLAVVSSNSPSFFSYRLLNIGDSIAFVFYGDTLKINFSSSTGAGITNIIIDGVQKDTFDGYAATPAFNVIKTISGLTKDYHTVVLEISSNKNPNATANWMYFNGITVNKEIGFKNWGISGITSGFVYDNIDKYVETTDDLYFFQLGTNDRQLSTNWQIISMYQRNIIEALLNQGDVIMMTANSGTQPNEEQAARKFHSNKVADENTKVANEYNLPHISNYNAFLYYTLMPNANYTDLMDPDGTHPNDKGHKLIYRNICEKTGLNSYIGIG